MKDDSKKPVKPAPRPTRPLDKDATTSSKPASKPRPAAKPATPKPAGATIHKPGVTPAKPGVERPAPKPLGAKPPTGTKPPVAVKPPAGAKPPAGDLDSFHAIRPGMMAPVAVLAEHTVVEGQTLSDLSLKYYKSAARAKWMKIYEANKAVIGDDPGKIKAGMVLKIPKID